MIRPLFSFRSRLGLAGAASALGILVALMLAVSPTRVQAEDQKEMNCMVLYTYCGCSWIATCLSEVSCPADAESGEACESDPE